MNEPALVDRTGPIQPVALSIEVCSGVVEVRTDRSRRAAVRAEPLTPNDQVALDLVSRARVTDTGDRLDVRFPDPPGMSGGGINIGGMVIMGGDVVINGQRINASPGGALNVTAIVPPGSSVTVRTKTAQVKVVGADDELTSVNIDTASGSAYVAGGQHVNASTASGNIEADGAKSAQLNAASGNLRAARLRGDANLNSMSGNVEAHCLTSGVVNARSMSGNVQVTAAPGVRPQVIASSMTGRTRTP